MKGEGDSKPGVQRSSLAHLKRLWRFIAPYRVRVYIAVVALIVAAGCVLALGQGLRHVIDAGFGSRDPHLLNVALAAVVGVSLLLAGATWVRFYLMMSIGERVIAADGRLDRATMRELAFSDPSARKRLEAIYAGDLHYSHSNGKIDDQASYIESLVKKTTVYEKYDYVRREFRLMGPGVAVMIGRVLVQSTSNGTRQNNDLNFLGVWRLDQGKWRFAAWQSCKNPPPEAKK